ncbi:MAG: PilZ domain-containing protein [candidate division NC10 bacterium]|nr:PilZ domain-containing protein [candidate division NC10 bacterium]
MASPRKPASKDEGVSPSHTGAERRSGMERRQSRDPHPPLGQSERRFTVRRKADRVSLETAIRIGPPGSGGRLYRRVSLEIPVIYRPLKADATPSETARRGVTSTLAPGGLGMLLDEEFPVGTTMEVLVRFEGDLLAADVEVVSVIRQGSQCLHNCRFTRLGTADRNWLTEYLRLRDEPPA